MSCEKLIELTESLKACAEGLFGPLIYAGNPIEPPFDIEFYQLTDASFSTEFDEMKRLLLAQTNALVALSQSLPVESLGILRDT